MSEKPNGRLPGETNANGEGSEGKKKKQREKMGASRKVFYFALSLLGVVVLAIAGRYIYVMFMDPMSAFKTPKPVTTPSPTPVQNELPEATITPTPEPTLSPEEELNAQADLEFMKNKVNILMLGYDRSPEREDEDSSLYRDENNNYRSDTIMLLTIDFETKRADLISIPRDTYAPIYNTKGRYKINAAFAKGGSVEGEGFLYARETVSKLLGVPIDYYAGVDMIGLKNVVDAMGGVDYDVDVRITLNGRVLEKGLQHLDGQQVLDYCRARKGISTDVGRADRQQRMLFAIFEQLKSRDQLVNIPKIYSSVQGDIATNLNAEQIAALAVFAMNLNTEDLNRHTLQGEYINDVYNASFYVLYNSKLKKLVKEVFGIDIKTNSRYDASYVRADKAAQEAKKLEKAAEELLTAFSYAEGVDELKHALNESASLTVRAVTADTESADEEPLDEAAITAAMDKLSAAILALCKKNGITQAQVNKAVMPAFIYYQLPTGNEKATENSTQTDTEEEEKGAA